MKPRIIIHNSVSLDLCVTGFDIDMGSHYGIASGFNADAHLIGSVTAKTGIEQFTPDIPAENEGDFKKPQICKKPYFVIVDSCGKMLNLLHVYRRSGYCRDIIVLISQKTPKEYLDYLEERNYDYVQVGKNKANLEESLAILSEKFGIKTILVDTGPTLSSILLDLGLADELSLIIYPMISTGKNKIFSNMKKKIILELIKQEEMSHALYVLYKVK